MKLYRASGTNERMKMYDGLKADLPAQISDSAIVEFYDLRQKRAIYMLEQNTSCNPVFDPTGAFVYIVKDTYKVRIDNSLKTVDCECLDFQHRGLKLKETKHAWAVECKHSLLVKLTIAELNNIPLK